MSYSTSGTSNKIRVRVADVAGTEQPVGLAWDIRQDGPLTKLVWHMGTRASVEALKRLPSLPTFEEVEARKRT